MAYACFVPAGVLAGGAVYTMYVLGTSADTDQRGMARLGLTLTALALLLVVVGAAARARAGKKDDA